MGGMVDKEKLNAGLAAFRKAARAEFGGKVYTRQGYLCCGGCASSALYGECLTAHAKRPDSIAGTVYYTLQDKSSMAKGYALYLNYGAFAPEDGSIGEDERAKKTHAIGTTLTRCLREAGLEVEWDGDIRTRIKVEPEARKVYRPVVYR